MLKYIPGSNEIMTDAVNVIRSLGSKIDNFDDIILRITSERAFCWNTIYFTLYYFYSYLVIFHYLFILNWNK